MSGAVFIVGASGVFGSHVARQLAATGTRHFMLAGRRADKAQPLRLELEQMGCTASFQSFDRETPDAALLRKLAPRVVIDAAGPFQGSSLALAEACIAARVHYIDLADARDFVQRFVSLDANAKAAGVVLMTGASSTPGLSHAVLDELTAGWCEVHSVFVAIAPGNRAPRGLSVVEAILSYVGEPVRQFRDGVWRDDRGWGLNQRIRIPGVGRRHVALCETPDLDLLVERYRPLQNASFKAGLELGMMQHGLRLLGRLRSKRLVPPLKGFAKPLLTIAGWLSPFGSDRGGMLVRATGRTDEGKPVHAEWSLAAVEGRGPIIPSLAAVALCNRIDRLGAGARSSAGTLSYAEMMSHLSRLGIAYQKEIQVIERPELFEKALGAAWQLLPEITRAIHRATPSITLAGMADVEGAENMGGRIVARLFGFPVEARQVPVRVVIESDGERENWQRIYPTRMMKSVMTRADANRSTVEERLGPFRFTLALTGTKAGIDMVPVKLRIWGLRLPLWLLPRVVATERASADGRKHLFDVHISAPLLGRLTHYKGWLEPVSAT